MKIKTSAILLSSALLLSGFNTIFASEPSVEPSAGKNSFGKEQKDLIINKLAHAISTQYVLEDKAVKFSQQLLAQNSSGAYAESATKADFIQQLNKSLYQITNDKHVSVRPTGGKKSGQGPQKRMMRKMVKAGPQKKMVKMEPGSVPSKSLKAQFGMDDGPSMATDILPGNIGLLTINDLMGEVSELDASMAKLVNTDGLIIDVRQCPGGNGEISTQLSSYFMPEGEVLMSHYTRGEPARISTSVVLPDGASRYLNKPVYLVTSGFTG
ncbi:MAG: S41 family peptidase, partial [Psychrosphaera sp.]|nr:S41 family peptidase [Psychrosphaera sp.]